MDLLPRPNTATRTISRPHSKLTRLCEVAAANGGPLTTFAAVAKALELSPSRVTQMFGHGEEVDGKNIKPETAGRLVAIFITAGVRCEVDWLYLDFDAFATRLANANPAAPAQHDKAISDGPAAGWTFTEDTVLPGLVELCLHPPRPGNEVPDSFYVDATLLFGTAFPDYEPDDGQDPRTIAIALHKAWLAIGSDSYRPLKGSVIGECVEAEHLRRVAGYVEITGPAPSGTLDGNPIGDQHLAVIAGTNTGNDPFAVTVAANWGSFVVIDAEAPPEHRGSNAPSGNKAAILNALIYKDVRKDELGRPVLARATMQRRSETMDPPS
jgi:hypothetical protein